MNKFELSSPEVKTMVCDLLHQIEYEYSQEYKYELDENCKLSELLQKKQQELERYKNIIDELEKWLVLQRDNLDKRVSEMKSDDKNMTRANHYTFIYNRVIDKLKELKGE